ncbi:MAG: SGNH/GDSL hydrolase family protein [Verrucomicrobiae bacterium]|nr:SGNH/GDSL hydrolase family protein [Verrucomicrobiae bacterium]
MNKQTCRSRQQSPATLLRPLTTILLLSLVMAIPGFAQETGEAARWQWRDARELTVEGKGWTDTKDFYDRLPARAESLVRAPVWNLSRDSAGISVRFVTEATTIAAQWQLRREALAMPHMPATGVSGLDLYVKEQGQWRWLGNGRPTRANEEKVLVSGLTAGRREYLLYLPLYNGVQEVKIGVPPGVELQAGPERPVRTKPVVFYGTSIVQGGCASRPGMAYPAILGRRFDLPTINLGFSGNARSEPEMARLLAELTPAAFVLDPLPNMTGELVTAQFEQFVRILREAHPQTPIVLVEHLEYTDGEFVGARREKVAAANAALRMIHQRLVKSGQQRLFLVTGDKLIGRDGEATVDGTHPTDLGFLRMADALAPVLRRALKTNR